MHTGPMSESQGKFDEPKETGRKCPECGGRMTCQTWESSDGAYEDYKYKCADPKCGHVHWVEGIDS